MVAPGINYLLKASVRFGIPSAATYCLLDIIQRRQFLPFNLPGWALISIAVAARPMIAIASRYYAKWANKRAAEASGAVIPPYLPDSTFSIISELGENLRDGYPTDVLKRFNDQYGNVVNFDLMNTSFLLTNEPEHIKAILATQFESFVKGPLFISQMDSMFGEGVFNSDGEMWKFHRAMTRPFFTRERISDFEIYDRNWNISLKLAKDRLAEGYSIDMQDLIARFTLDSASEFLFGKNVESLSAGLPYHQEVAKKNSREFFDHPSNQFVKAFSDALLLIAKRLTMGEEWALAEFTGDRIIPLRKTVEDFVEPMMKAALEKREQDILLGKDPSEKEESNLLSHLVNHTQDPKILKDEVINLLVAGRDTTMSLLAFSVYMLSEHPDIEKRLREEIYEKVGPSEAPKYENMREMRYMKAFINDHPTQGTVHLRCTHSIYMTFIVMRFGRKSIAPVVLPATGPGEKPIYVPKDVICIYTTLNMQRRTDLWGPDALTFDPDRFLDERLQKYLVSNPYIFCPFNAGPRICLGQQFAYNEASYYLIRLLQNFTEFTLDSTSNLPPPAHWRNGEGLKATEKIFPAAHLTLFIKGGLWVRMKEIKYENSGM
ncbi:Cytochrome P450 monooxygenase 75 [Psilocybe cubensis]|uniref:Cytochrome P450 monooxygenase 75 n=1 Tax=Psilocybe cubensis TaxID=181762 RepID=A0ACB8GSG8_PSICU|nr:Cytochrome P450 monooxygenase 75 [Psilocybe cubensis]KAH9478516.1 Cytochrome P450 monooxygenase 75 [Psilocybe cubensis]